MKILAYMIWKFPLYLGIFIPRRSLIWDVKTWMAAPAVNPFTRVSDRREHITPILNRYIANWNTQLL